MRSNSRYASFSHAPRRRPPRSPPPTTTHGPRAAPLSRLPQTNKKAVRSNPFAFEHVSPAGKANEEIVHAAVSQRGSLLYYADPTMQDNKMIAKVAVTNGLALSYVSPRLQNDRDLVGFAVTKEEKRPWRGSQLKFSSRALVVDHDLVRESRGGMRDHHIWREVSFPVFDRPAERTAEARALSVCYVVRSTRATNHPILCLTHPAAIPRCTAGH